VEAVAGNRQAEEKVGGGEVQALIEGVAIAVRTDGHGSRVLPWHRGYQYMRLRQPLEIKAEAYFAPIDEDWRINSLLRTAIFYSHRSDVVSSSDSVLL